MHKLLMSWANVVSSARLLLAGIWVIAFFGNDAQGHTLGAVALAAAVSVLRQPFPYSRQAHGPSSSSFKRTTSVADRMASQRSMPFKQTLRITLLRHLERKAPDNA